MSVEKDIPDSLVMSVEELDLPATAEGILQVLRKVLSKPYVQSIKLSTGKPIEVAWYKDMSDSLHIGEPDESDDSVLSRVEISEYDSTEPSKEAFMSAVLQMNADGLQVTHVFVGAISFFKSWLGYPSLLRFPDIEGTEYKNFMGYNLLEVESLEEDVVVLLGGPTKSDRLVDLTTAVKLTT